MKITIKQPLQARLDLTPNGIKQGKFFRAVSSIRSPNEEVFIRLDRHIYRADNSATGWTKDITSHCTLDSSALFTNVRYLDVELICWDVPK